MLRADVFESSESGVFLPSSLGMAHPSHLQLLHLRLMKGPTSSDRKVEDANQLLLGPTESYPQSSGLAVKFPKISTLY